MPLMPLSANRYIGGTATAELTNSTLLEYQI